MPTSLAPFSVPCSLGFGLTEHQPWERKIGLHFEKAVRAPFFFKTFAIRFLKTGTRLTVSWGLSREQRQLEQKCVQK